MNSHSDAVSTTLAEELAAVAGTILDRSLVPDDDLFAVGARSMDIVRLLSAIDRRWGVRIRGIDVFDNPTPSALADVIDRVASSQTPPTE